MLPEATGQGQHFDARGHSFSPCGPTLSRHKWLCLCSFVIESGSAPSTNDWNKQGTQILDKEICIKEKISFHLLYVSCIYVTCQVLQY